MHGLRNTAALLGLMIISPVAVYGKAAPMVFDHITVQEGLSQSTVLDVLQDSQGFIWIATEAGLNRFDGYQMHRYTHDRSDPTALRSDFVWEIAEDTNGDLWLATKGGGLVRWERAADCFHTYLHDPADAKSLSSNTVRAVLIDDAGNVWAGTRGGGLNRLDPITGEFTRFRHNPLDPASLSDDSVFDIEADREGRLWIGTNAGLNVLDAGRREFIRYRHDQDDGRSLSDDVVMTVYEDNAGTIWLGTYKGGLNRFDAQQGSFERFRHGVGDEYSLSHDYVWTILEDSDGRLWVGTENGLNLLDRASGHFARYHKDPTDSASLSNSYVMSLYQDASGLLWVGTRGDGVSRWNPRSWTFGHFKNERLKGALVTSFAADASGGVWIGTLGAGLTHFEPESGTIVPVESYLKGSSKLSDERAMSLLMDRAGDLWVGTMTGGLNRLNLDRGTIKTYRHDPEDSSSLGANGIMSMFEDGAGDLWIGTFGGGLNHLDRSTGKFRRFPHDPGDPSSLSSPRATAIVEDAEGNIWVATDDAGLNLLDRASGKFRHFGHDDNNPESLSSDSLYALHLDDKGNLWIGTADGGLDRMLGSSSDPQSIRFENLSQNQGLTSNVVYGVQSDRRGRLWLSGTNGLARYDPGRGEIKTFHRNHGLQGEEFNFGAYHRGPDGRLYFGGTNGLNAFDPLAVAETQQIPPVVLTAFEKFNEPADTALPPPLLDRVDLSYSDDVITFEFAALDFVAPEKNRYAYRLEGFDKEWVEQGNRRRATYTNLDAGDYLFRVRAANSDGVWNEEGLSIPVSVAAAPWETPWAYAAYLAVMFLALGGVMSWQRRRLQQAAQIRQLAYYDTLTGLPNQQLFRQRLAQAVSDAAEKQDGLAVLYADLDRFKRINDTLGHSIGDEIIKSVAVRLSQCVHRRGDGIGRYELARLGGDEFLIFLRHREAEAEAKAMAKDIAETLSEPFTDGGQELVVTASIGGAVYPDHGRDGEALLKAADTAVYQAKASGRRHFQLYSRNMSARAMHRLSLENDIRVALEQNQFQLYYQPKYRAHDLKIVGAEALLRWFHPTRGEISPGSFIPVAEEAGLIVEIGHWVTGAACAQLRSWAQESLPAVPVAINLSAEEFYRGDPVAMIAEATARANVNASELEIEITESALMRDTSKVSESLQALKRLGVSLSVDDFGTGYSSLAYLKRFPLDTLKIDRSFVREIATDMDDAAICSAIIAMARSLGLNVVAEGVESDAQLRRLRTEGCDQIQGFLLSRPVPADLFMELLLAQSPPAAVSRDGEQDIPVDKIVRLAQRKP